MEGFLAIGHAAFSSADCLAENLLQYAQDTFTPALVLSAVQQVSIQKQILNFFIDLMSACETHERNPIPAGKPH